MEEGSYISFGGDYTVYAAHYGELAALNSLYDPDGARNLPRRDTIGALCLVLLRRNMGRYVAKDVIAKEVDGVLGVSSPDIQAPRHLGNNGWDILSSRYDPDYDGGGSVAYMMRSLSLPERYRPARRSARLSDEEFGNIVEFWHNSCASCGRRIGDCGVNGKPVLSLDQAHLNPDFPLDHKCGEHINCIPQCPYCNRSHRDDVEYGVVVQADGALRAVAVAYRNPELEDKRRAEQGESAFLYAMNYNMKNIAWRIR